jgi:hypothetical protein
MGQPMTSSEPQQSKQPEQPVPARHNWPWIILAVAATVVIVAVVVRQSSAPTPVAQIAAPAPVTTNVTSSAAATVRTPQSTPKPSPTRTSTPRPSPTVAPEQVAAAKFAQLLNNGDDAGAIAMTEPGSTAHLYAEGIQLLADGRYGILSSEKRASPALSAFVLAPDGLITSLSRNGVSLDKLIAPGDGQVYIA